MHVFSFEVSHVDFNVNATLYENGSVMNNFMHLNVLI